MPFPDLPGQCGFIWARDFQPLYKTQQLGTTFSFFHLRSRFASSRHEVMHLMHFSLWLTAAPLLVENFQAMPPLVDNSEKQLSPFLHSALSLVRIIQYFLLLSISSNYGLLLIAQTWLSNDTADEAVAFLGWIVKDNWPSSALGGFSMYVCDSISAFSYHDPHLGRIRNGI